MRQIQKRSLLSAVLYGPELGWGAQVGCDFGTISGLAVCALLLHALDLVTGIRLMTVFGIDQEQNPVARALFQSGGPAELAIVKVGVVATGVVVLLWFARAGRPRLARNAMVAIALLGMLGFSSNLV